MTKFEVPDIFNLASFLTDRHVVEGRGARTALYYQDQRISYSELLAMVNRTGNMLKHLGLEIENRIDVIDDEISDWVVEHTYAEGTTAGGEAGVVVEGGLATVVKTEVAQGDDGLKPEVKTYVAEDGTQDDEPLPEPNPNEINPDLVNPDTTTNNIDEAPGGIDSGYAEGTTADGGETGDCGDGVVCG